MSLKVYAYDKCGTCRKAAAWLLENKIKHRTLPIRDTPPTKAELLKMLAAQGGDMRKLFNTSGLDYKALGMKDKMAALGEDALLELLAANGNLVKRPFVLGDSVALVGFHPEVWARSFGKSV